MLMACLDSIRQFSDGLEAQTIVVDNNSGDGSREVVGKEFPEVEIVNSGGNLGFGRANNLALPLVKAPFILFLNPDTELRSGALRAMLKHLQSQADVGAVGCRLTDSTGRTQSLGLQTFPNPFWEFVRLAFYTESLGRRWPSLFRWADAEQSGFVVKIYGACLLVKREVVECIGGFDDRYFMYCEDVDFCRRIAEAGWKLYYLNDPAIIHHGGAASAKAPGAFSILMTCQSISAYMQKYYGFSGRILYRLLVLLASALRLTALLFLRPAILLHRNIAARQIDSSARRYGLMLRWALGLEKVKPSAG